jgi:hypothetical protein
VVLSEGLLSYFTGSNSVACDATKKMHVEHFLQEVIRTDSIHLTDTCRPLCGGCTLMFPAGMGCFADAERRRLSRVLRVVPYNLYALVSPVVQHPRAKSSDMFCLGLAYHTARKMALVTYLSHAVVVLRWNSAGCCCCLASVWSSWITESLSSPHQISAG